MGAAASSVKLSIAHAPVNGCATGGRRAPAFQGLRASRANLALAEAKGTANQLEDMGGARQSRLNSRRGGHRGSVG